MKKISLQHSPSSLSLPLQFPLMPMGGIVEAVQEISEALIEVSIMKNFMVITLLIACRPVTFLWWQVVCLYSTARELFIDTHLSVT